MNFKEQESKQKLRGGYYTPQTIAALLSRWALSDGATTILEPSCGDGNFLQAIYKHMSLADQPISLSIEAIEIVPEEAAKAEKMSANLRDIGAKVQVINHDIFSWLGNGNTERRWDAIIGNPPYIRYQYFENVQREMAETIFKKANVPFSKRTNAWVPLLIASVMHLVPGGRLAMVVPAELLHIQHASGLRQLLEQEMETIILINIREMVFPDVLQGVVLVLSVKRRDRNFMPLVQVHTEQLSLMFQEPEKIAKIAIIDIDTVHDLSKMDVTCIDQSIQKSIDDTAGEWMLGLLTEKEATLLRHLKGRKDVFRFDTIADVDKCRIRNPWYVVPYVWASEVSLLKRCHLFPRLVVNELKANSTDTAYRVRLKHDYKARTKDITFSFLNSLTFLSAELEGRHYGGGVLELVPSEIEKLLIPLRPIAESKFNQIDAMIRNNATLDEIVDFTDPILLGEGLGLTDIEICTIRKAHRRLLKRRLRT